MEPTNRLPGVLTEVFRCQQIWDDQDHPIPLDSNLSVYEAVTLNEAVHELKPSLSVGNETGQRGSILAIIGLLEKITLDEVTASIMRVSIRRGSVIA